MLSSACNIIILYNSEEPGLGFYTGICGWVRGLVRNLLYHRQSLASLPIVYSFPTRRSSDLDGTLRFRFVDRTVDVPAGGTVFVPAGVAHAYEAIDARYLIVLTPDRKSTRLNSSHRCKSYAVFCV